ncbi:MAG: hypothetical protein EAZ55_07920 [Cytophagales bacterium]|nr:MAG: hypothetical protein EAZ55_07920 [Cytophagales bacterium]
MILHKIVFLRVACFDYHIQVLHPKGTCIVAKEGAGKSSLLRAIQFLQPQETFQQLEEALYWFPKPQQSYLFFEIETREKFTLLLKREAGQQLLFFRIDGLLSDWHYENIAQNINSFKELQKFLLQEHFVLYPLQPQEISQELWGKTGIKHAINFHPQRHYFPQICKNDYLKLATVRKMQLSFDPEKNSTLKKIIHYEKQLQQWKNCHQAINQYEQLEAELQGKNHYIGELYTDFLEKYEHKKYDIEVSLAEKIKEMNQIQQRMNLQYKSEEIRLERHYGKLSAWIEQQPQSPEASQWKEDAKKTQQEADKIRKQIAEETQKIGLVNREKNELEAFLKELNQWAEELSEAGYSPQKNTENSTDLVREVYLHIKHLQQEIYKIEQQQQQIITNLPTPENQSFAIEDLKWAYWKKMTQNLDEKESYLDNLYEHAFFQLSTEIEQWLEVHKQLRKHLKNINQTLQNYHCQLQMKTNEALMQTLATLRQKTETTKEQFLLSFFQPSAVSFGEKMIQLKQLMQEKKVIQLSQTFEIIWRESTPKKKNKQHRQHQFWVQLLLQTTFWRIQYQAQSPAYPHSLPIAFDDVDIFSADALQRILEMLWKENWLPIFTFNDAHPFLNKQLLPHHTWTW